MFTYEKPTEASMIYFEEQLCERECVYTFMNQMSSKYEASIVSIDTTTFFPLAAQREQQ